MPSTLTLASPGQYGFGLSVIKSLFDSVGTEDAHDKLYYEDEMGGLQGPFSGAQMYQWYIDGHMPLEIDLR